MESNQRLFISNANLKKLNLIDSFLVPNKVKKRLVYLSVTCTLLECEKNIHVPSTDFKD